MIVLKVLFGKKCPLLNNHEAIRNTIVMVRRRNNNYFSRNNVVNLIWRLFTESRVYFAMMANDVDLKNSSLPYTNLQSTAAIIANCQSFRGDDLLQALMPQKINNNANPYKGKGTGTPGGSEGGNYRDNGNSTGGNNHRDHGNNNRDRNRQNDTNARNGDRQQRTVVEGRQFYNPIIQRAMGPVLSKSNFLACPIFSKEDTLDTNISRHLNVLVYALV